MPDNLDDLYDDLISGEPGEQHLFEHDDDSALITPNATDFNDDEFDNDIQLFELPSIDGEDEEEEETTTTTSQWDSLAENEVINELLLAKGIADPSKLNYENEDGTLSEVNFYELPYNEQLNILKANDDVNTILDTEEIDTINFLRTHNVTLEEAIEYYQRKAIEDH